MYLPAHFAQNHPAALHELMREHPLATLVTLSPQGLDANPLPLLLAADGTELHGHVARANPLWREHPAGQDVLALFHGPQAYVSPNWYPSKHEHGKAVPTWNYLTVQVRGRLECVDDPVWLRAFLERLTATHEATQERPWQVTDAPADYIAKMLKAVVGLRIAITDIAGKWKASQNQPAVNRAGVADALDASDPAMAAAIRAATSNP